MAQHVLNNLGMDSRAREVGGSVAQIVNPDTGEPRSLQAPMEHSIDIRLIEGPPGCRDKNKVRCYFGVVLA